MKKETGPSIRSRRRHHILWDACCLIVAIFIYFISDLILKGELFSRFYDVLIPPIWSLICKVWEFLVEHQKQSLAVLFFVLEAVALFLDIYGRNILAFLAAAYLLSVFVFAINIQAGFTNNGSTNSATNNRSSQQGAAAERQLRVVEIVFSMVQMMLTFLHLILAAFADFKFNLGWSVFPLLYAAIAMAFSFIIGTETTGRETTNGQPNEQQPDVELASGITTASADTSLATISTTFTDETGDSIV